MTDYLTSDKRLFGRRKGRPLHKRKSRLMNELLPHLQIDLKASGLDAGASPEKAGTLFSGAFEAFWMEIGFGGGEHLAAEAELHPTVGFIGCEPFLNGVAGLLDHIDLKALKNIRIFADDARALLDVMPARSVARCSVLFADPWPKARHAERRFIGPSNLDRLARVLKPGALLRLATDDLQLARWMREHVGAHKCFKILRDEMTPPGDWIPTRYEEKGRRAGRLPHYLDAVRLG